MNKECSSYDVEEDYGESSKKRPRTQAPETEKIIIDLAPELRLDSSCRTCKRTDREEQLLLCDECNNCFHTDCLSPPVITLAESEWYCHLCTDLSKNQNITVQENTNISKFLYILYTI